MGVIWVTISLVEKKRKISTFKNQTHIYNIFRSRQYLQHYVWWGGGVYTMQYIENMSSVILPPPPPPEIPHHFLVLPKKSYRVKVLYSG